LIIASKFDVRGLLMVAAVHAKESAGPSSVLVKKSGFLLDEMSSKYLLL
jgi:hypothetical protein